MIRTITTAAIVAAAGITAANAGTLPEGTVVCGDSLDMLDLQIAALDGDQEVIRRMTSADGPCVVTKGDYSFELLQVDRRVAQLRVETPSGEYEVWAPAWAAKSDGP